MSPPIHCCMTSHTFKDDNTSIQANMFTRSLFFGRAEHQWSASRPWIWTQVAHSNPAKGVVLSLLNVSISRRGQTQKVCRWRRCIEHSSAFHWKNQGESVVTNIINVHNPNSQQLDLEFKKFDTRSLLCLEPTSESLFQWCHHRFSHTKDQTYCDCRWMLFSRLATELQYKVAAQRGSCPRLERWDCQTQLLLLCELGTPRSWAKLWFQCLQSKSWKSWNPKGHIE